jgi:hypothetical protein
MSALGRGAEDEGLSFGCLRILGACQTLMLSSSTIEVVSRTKTTTRQLLDKL